MVTSYIIGTTKDRALSTQNSLHAFGLGITMTSNQWSTARES
jgi:hypothetical protein